MNKIESIINSGKHINRECRSVFLSEGAGDEWQTPIGSGSGGEGWSPLKFLTSTLLDCKKIPFLRTKAHLALDMIGHLLYDIMS